MPRAKGGTFVIEEQVNQAPESPAPQPPAQVPIDLAATFPSPGTARAVRAPAVGGPAAQPERFVPQISRRAISHEGSEPDDPGFIPEPLPTPIPIAAIPPSRGVLILQPGQAPSPTAYASTQQSPPDHPAIPGPSPAVALPSVPDRVVRPAADSPAWRVPDGESRTGLVVRALSGSVSLLSGSVLLIVFLFLMSAWIGRMEIFEAPAFAPGVLALAAGLTGVLEVTAGLRMLAGSPLPHSTYGLAFLVQSGGSLAAVLISAWNQYVHKLDLNSEVWFMAAVLAAAMVPPLARIAAMLVPASGRLLGARDLGAGVSMRAVPFVLWAPVTAGLAGPLLPLLIVGSIVALSQAVKQGDMSGLVVGLAVALILGAILTANIVAGIALLRRATWSVALGGVSGLLGSVLGLALVSVPAVMLAADRHLGFSAVGAFASLGLVIAAIVTPSVVLAAGAIKFRFRLPPYLEAAGQQPSGARQGLFELLVPAPPAER